eukprot:6205538-Pleurochrysis_carterae.AAC.7
MCASLRSSNISRAFNHQTRVTARPPSRCRMERMGRRTGACRSRGPVRLRTVAGGDTQRTPIVCPPIATLKGFTIIFLQDKRLVSPCRFMQGYRSCSFAILEEHTVSTRQASGAHAGVYHTTTSAKAELTQRKRMIVRYVLNCQVEDW